MEISGITRRLIDFAKGLVGHLTGGLGHTTIVTGVFMAGVSGSANADTAALASVLVPVLKDEGYDDGYSCAMVASAGALGPVIPPSIMMVIYAGVTSISIGTLFMAGFIPGILIGIGYMVVNYLYARHTGIPRSKFAGWKYLGKSFISALPALMLPVIIVGGILSGAVTATESGVLACVYSFFYGLVGKKITKQNLKECFLGGISGTANAAVLAAQELRETYPEAEIATIDSFAASMGEGLLVLEAAEMIERGCAFQEITDYILERRNMMCQFFTVDDLTYLHRGGRISGAKALVGNVLNIKPILRGDEIGRIVMCGKKRGSRRALDELAERYAFRALDMSADISIAHADNDEGTAYLLAELRKKGFTGDCITVIYEPVTGSHVGPGTVALFFPGTEK